LRPLWSHFMLERMPAANTAGIRHVATSKMSGPSPAPMIATDLVWFAALASTALITVDVWLANQTRLAALTAADDLTIVRAAVIGSHRVRRAVRWSVVSAPRPAGLPAVRRRARRHDLCLAFWAELGRS
jgi:hypothetical protein